MARKTTTESRRHFEQLVKDTEAKFANNPKGYRRRLALLAIVGYCYLFGILLLTLALMGLSIFGAMNSNVFLMLLIKKKLILVLLAFFYVMLKALWVKIEAPIGYALNRKQYRQFYREMDELGKVLKAPKIHQILITEEFNAAISQTPRLGVFGWQKNVLILGLPLLLSMNRAQCLAVVAHEYGHLSGNHSRFSGWIYRVRMTWLKLMDAFDQTGGWAHRVFGKFFDWYAPYFNAYSFALSRANEYEADAVAVELTSGRDFVDALTLSYIVPELLEQHYWSDVNQQVGHSEQINTRIYSALFESIKQIDTSPEQIKALIEKALQEETNNTDTHPALSDRIGIYSDVRPEPGLAEQSAAETFMGEQLPVLLTDFDRQWAIENEQAWRERFRYLENSKQELQSLEQKQALNSDELWDLAAWTHELKPDVDALPLFENFLAQHQDDSEANYVVGKLLLDRGEARGTEFLEKAMLSRHHIIPACEAAFCYYHDRSEQSLAEPYRLKAEHQIDLQRQAADEREQLTAKDELIGDELLSEQWLIYLTEQLQKITQLKAAWICQKKLTLFVDEPVYVIIYQCGFWHSEEKIEQAIVNTLDFPVQFYVISSQGDFKQLARKAIKKTKVAKQLF